MRENRNQNPDYLPPAGEAAALGLQHVLAMFAGNVAPAFIIAGAAGLAAAETVYLIQMAMLFAGLATLLQTVGAGKIGARLPVMQGTSFAFVPIMIPLAKTAGMGAVVCGAIVGGIFHFFVGVFAAASLRKHIPPLISGLIIMSIGIFLFPVGIQYAAGGAWAMHNKPELFGTLANWSLAMLVVLVTVGVKFFARGFATSAAALIGIVAGCAAAVLLDLVHYGGIAKAGWFELPRPFKFGFHFTITAAAAFCLMSVVSAVETVGDISVVTKTGAGREATKDEIAGGTMADGLGTAVAGLFGALPNTSYSQNAGLVALTGVMSRHVVSVGALFLIAAGLIPKIGAVIAAMPPAVLGGGVIVMFGMVASAGLKMLADVKMTPRNMAVIAVSLSFGIGLKAMPMSLHLLPEEVRLLLTSGLLPVAVVAFALNAVLPKDKEKKETGVKTSS